MLHCGLSGKHLDMRRFKITKKDLIVPLKKYPTLRNKNFVLLYWVVTQTLYFQKCQPPDTDICLSSSSPLLYVHSQVVNLLCLWFGAGQSACRHANRVCLFFLLQQASAGNEVNQSCEQAFKQKSNGEPNSWTLVLWCFGHTAFWWNRPVNYAADLKWIWKAGEVNSSVETAAFHSEYIYRWMTASTLALQKWSQLLPCDGCWHGAFGVRIWQLKHIHLTDK